MVMFSRCRRESAADGTTERCPGHPLTPGEEENTMVRNHKVGLRPRLDKVNVRAGK